MCLPSPADPQPVTVWHPLCCHWAGTHSCPPSALETQRHLTQGSSPKLHRYCASNTSNTQLHWQWRISKETLTTLKLFQWIIELYLGKALVTFSRCSNNCIVPFMPCDQRQKGPSSRAHSAVNDEAGSSIPRDRHYLLDIFSRPNTTHTYRVRWSSSSQNPACAHAAYVRDGDFDPFLISSRTLRTVAPSQYWTTSGRGGQAEPLWAQVRNSAWIVE